MASSGHRGGDVNVSTAVSRREAALVDAAAAAAVVVMGAAAAEVRAEEGWPAAAEVVDTRSAAE